MFNRKEEKTDQCEEEEEEENWDISESTSDGYAPDGRKLIFNLQSCKTKILQTEILI